MVTAANGALLTCDIPTREYLVNLNLKQPHTTKFIIKELDDTHLWVKPDKDKIDFIQEKVKEFNNLNVYTPPTREEVQEKAQGKRG